MQAVLYVGHGSRVAKACEETHAFFQKCMENIPVPTQELCFLELAEPGIEEGIRRCVNRGADHITVFPLFLLAASHVKRDIPSALAEAKKKYPHVSIQFESPFGVNERMVHIVIDQMKKKENFSGRCHVLLVGRGSSDPDTQKDMRQIVELIKERYPFQIVEVAYLAAAVPTFREGLERAKAWEKGKVFVVPYLLFTGTLINEMKEIIAKMKDEQTPFVLCDPLGRHSDLVQVVKTRVSGLLKLQK